VEDWEGVLKDLEMGLHAVGRQPAGLVGEMMLVREFQKDPQNLAGRMTHGCKKPDMESSSARTWGRDCIGLEQSGGDGGRAEETAVRWRCASRRFDTSLCAGQVHPEICRCRWSPAQWHHITLQGEAGRLKISLMDYRAGKRFRGMVESLMGTRFAEDLRTLLSSS